MNWAFPTGREEKREFLLAAVEKVETTLLDGAAEGEANATLPISSVDALYQSGLLALKLPTELGGAEADPLTQLEVIEAVSQVDPSAGWCVMIGATCIGLPGAFLPDVAIDAMFAEGRVPKAAAAFRPTGEATPVAGGYLVNGRWPFASGIRHSDWVWGGALVPHDGEVSSDVRMVTFPTYQVKIHDNWDVAGLRGTGSCDFSVSDLFVPECFVWDILGAEPKRGGPVYRMGVPGFVVHEHAAFAFGVARRALDAILDQAQSKYRGYMPPSKIANRPSFQRAMGECDMRLRAARALAVELLEGAWTEVCREGVIAPRLQAELRASAVYATDVAVDVVTQAFRYGGGSALMSSNTLQQCLRDINAGTQHFMVSETAYEIHGQFALGYEDANPLG